MPSLTTYQRFERSYDHAVSALPTSNSSDSTSQESILIRYAIVMGVASMDAYFTKKFVEKLVNFVKKKGINDDIVALFKDSGIDEKIYLSLLDKRKPFRVITSKVQNRLHGMTTQKFHKIDELFKKYKIHKLCSKSIEYSRQNYHRIEHKTYRMRIEWLVDRRNTIVHTCDLNHHNRFQDVDLIQVKKYLETLGHFVTSADNILDQELR
jgi:hypothetical protein